METDQIVMTITPAFKKLSPETRKALIRAVDALHRAAKNGYFGPVAKAQVTQTEEKTNA